MIAEGPWSTFPERPGLYRAAVLIPHFGRLRDIRARYGPLEEAKYGRVWGNLEILDGTKGDIGDMYKLETGRRGFRDGYSPGALIHEVVDMTWSWVVGADSNLADPRAACALADKRDHKRPTRGTARQLLNRFTVAVCTVDDMVDPPEDPLFVHDLADPVETLTGYYAEGFRALIGLANAYYIELPQGIEQSMNELEVRIQHGG